MGVSPRAGVESSRWLSTMAWAMSKSFLPVCCEWSRSNSKATLSLAPCRSIRMPLARSITARRPNAHEIVVLGEPAQGDVDRSLKVRSVPVGDVAEHAALRRFADEVGIVATQESDHGARRFAHDLGDVLERVVGAFA